MNFIEAMEEMKQGKTVVSSNRGYYINQGGDIMTTLLDYHEWEVCTQSANVLMGSEFFTQQKKVTSLLDISVEGAKATFIGEECYFDGENWRDCDNDYLLKSLHNELVIFNLDNWRLI